MQDAKTIQDQLEGMITRTNIKALIVQEHQTLIATRKYVAERELTKMKFLREMFEFSQKLLDQREAQLQGVEPAPTAAVLEGLQAAKAEISRLEQQTKEQVLSHNGALVALLDLEAALRREELETIARGRGLVTQGERLVQKATESAQARAEIEATQETPAPESPPSAPSAPESPSTPQEVPGFLDSLEGVEEAEPEPQETAEAVLAKEPMDAPKQKAATRRPRGKA